LLVSSELLAVETGGQPELVTRGAFGLAPNSPQFLPDGRTFVYFQYTGIPETSGLYLSSLDQPAPKFIGPADSTARWLPPNRLAFVSQGRLVARPFDKSKGEFSGPTQTIGDGHGNTQTGHGGFSISTNGVIAYRPLGDRDNGHLVWLDRNGAAAGAPIDTKGPIASIAFSPDGTRLAVDMSISGNRDIWISDLLRGGLTRLTFDNAVDGMPAWSPDSRTVVYESARKVGFDIWAKASNGSGAEARWLERPGNQWPYEISPDGKWLLYFEAENAGDVMALPLPAGSNSTPVAIVATPFSESQGAISPDGAWVAYTTTESGRDEVVVQSFPKADGKWQVSAEGGHSPQWGPGGRELYFVSGSTMMAATARPAGRSFDFAPPAKLFDLQIVPRNSRAQYAVDRRGRFLVNSPATKSVGETTPITLLLNWKPGVKQ